MANQKKSYVHSELGPYVITKKKNAKRVTLRIGRDGVPTVSIPWHAPYVLGQSFFSRQSEWVKEHLDPKELFESGDVYRMYDDTEVVIGATDGNNSTRRSIGRLELRLNFSEPEKAQTYAEGIIKKQLSADSESVVGPLVSRLSTKMGYVPKVVRYRSTTSRWGSCSSKQVLTFSSYIAQLPNDLIEYIVVHELAHIPQMNHGPNFWALVEAEIPNHRALRKTLKQYNLRPDLKKIM